MRPNPRLYAETITAKRGFRFSEAGLVSLGLGNAVKDAQKRGLSEFLRGGGVVRTGFHTPEALSRPLDKKNVDMLTAHGYISKQSVFMLDTFDILRGKGQTWFSSFSSSRNRLYQVFKVHFLLSSELFF